MDIQWIEGFCIKVEISGDEVTVSANREGLLSLAEQLTALADETSGSHIHYDGFNSLEEGSAGMIIEKTE
ncbi:MAG: hypothetical protein IKH13_09140 [Clostridia bacterium]|nr:hypothetical protein [Clostridia bacterium]MBR6426461.1 hypothetical protein [Clostridia bacterium]